MPRKSRIENRKGTRRMAVSQTAIINQNRWVERAFQACDKGISFGEILRLYCAAKAHPVGDFRRQSDPTEIEKARFPRAKNFRAAPLRMTRTLAALRTTILDFVPGLEETVAGD